MSACPRCGAEHRGPECQGEKDPDTLKSQRARIVGGCYRIESELGQGAMGIVYRAHDEWLGRPVALKLIAPAWSYSSDDADSMLRKEAQALASIRSEHVVQVYAFGEHAGSYFFRHGVRPRE
jgi:serine/threonine protein kinase